MSEQNAVLTYALAYAAEGMQVIPLYGIIGGACQCDKASCRSPGKHPLIDDWQENATTDEVKIRAWFENNPHRNIGIVTGRESGIIAVDADLYKGADIDALADEVGEPLTESGTQETGGGGEHYIFAHPGGDYIRSRLSFRHGIDVKADGGYIVAAPSLHISGKRYEWQIGQGPDLREPAPEKLIKLIGTYTEKLAQIEQVTHVVDVHEYNLLTQALSAIDPACDREKWLTVGMALHSTGWGLPAYELWHEWSARAPDKYTPDTMPTEWQSFQREGIKLGTVYEYAKAAGYEQPPLAPMKITDLPALETQSKKTTGPDGRPCYFPVFTLDELAEYAKRNPIEEYWRGSVLHKGCRTLIVGPPKVGKSLFVQGLCLGGAAGGEFMGDSFSRPIRMLWLQAEVREEYLNGRIAEMTPFNTMTTPEILRLKSNLFVTGRFYADLNQPDVAAELVRIITEREVDVVVVDPMINLTTAEENDNREMMNFLQNGIDGVITATGAGVVLIHHTSKGVGLKIDAGADPFDSIRGASALRGWYDSGIILTRSKKHDHIKVYYECRNERAPEPHEAHYNFNTGDWHYIEPEIKQRADGGAEVPLITHDPYPSMLEEIKQGGRTREQLQAFWMEETGGSARTFSRIWAQFLDHEHVITKWHNNKKVAYYCGPIPVQNMTEKGGKNGRV